MWFAVRGTKSKVGKTHGLHSSPDAARFVGAGVAGGMSPVDPVVGMHVTSDLPTAVSFAMFSGDPAATPGLSEAEKERVELPLVSRPDQLCLLAALSGRTS
jgi:hypothetical protein